MTSKAQHCSQFQPPWKVVYKNRWDKDVETWFGNRDYADKFCANLEKHGVLNYTTTELTIYGDRVTVVSTNAYKDDTADTVSIDKG